MAKFKTTTIANRRYDGKCGFGKTSAASESALRRLFGFALGIALVDKVLEDATVARVVQMEDISRGLFEYLCADAPARIGDSSSLLYSVAQIRRK